MNIIVITAIVIGLGDRGKIYSEYALKYPKRFKIIAGADPVAEKRENFRVSHNLDESNLYSTWENLFQIGRIADVAIITTPDKVHFEPAMKAMEMGYDILLEKPMATTKEECEILVKTSKERDLVLQICHVLRYTKFYSKIAKAIEAGLIGNIVNINMMENVSYYHYAHSYIRGNWHNREKSSPMILAKCSHDLDAMYWFAKSKPSKISSFGGLDHFKKDNSNLPARCTDGCPIQSECLYYAPRIYEEIVPLLHLSSKSGTIGEKLVSKIALKYPKVKNYPPFSKINDYDGWPVSIISSDTSIKGKRTALETGPYGRCVYQVEDHNVVDHQIVSIQFENNITATLTMHGHSSVEGRYIRIDGTSGTIYGEFLTAHQKLVHIDSLTNKKSTLYQTSELDGHGGGDEKLMEDFIQFMEKRKTQPDLEGLTNGEKSIISHLMAFAADIARIENKIVDFEEF